MARPEMKGKECLNTKVIFWLVLILLEVLLGGPNITANLSFICLSEHETCAHVDTVQICA